MSSLLQVLSEPAELASVVNRACHREVRIQTGQAVEFTDITEEVERCVVQARIRMGWVNIQVLHTTCGIVVNENEPLLLEDLKDTLERLVGSDRAYRHDDFEIRRTNLEPGERKNGHAHCKGLFLRASETLNVINGTLRLGRWQRVFLVELDRPRERSVSIMVMGQPGVPSENLR